MLILLSPAKKLLKADIPYGGITSNILFPEKTKTLVRLMKSKSVEEIAALMDLSQDLASLNFQRYQEFAMDTTQEIEGYPAVFLFQGDVYQGLNVAAWDQTTVSYSQEHLCILSGLYGLLKPLDKIQPYRLEMGVRLENPEGKTLYNFWQETVTQTLNQQLKSHKNPKIINLASTEYFKVVDEKKLNYPVITINFYEKKNDQLKMIGIHAKKARGVMAKFIMQNQIDTLNQLKEFKGLGYLYDPTHFSETHLNFVRST